MKASFLPSQNEHEPNGHHVKCEFHVVPEPSRINAPDPINGSEKHLSPP